MWVSSPFARRAISSRRFYEHSSVLKFLEANFGLPTLASVNHRFDTSTTGSNYQANGAPAPPRDGRADIGDLMQCFDFSPEDPIPRRLTKPP